MWFRHLDYDSGTPVADLGPAAIDALLVAIQGPHQDTPRPVVLPPGRRSRGGGA